MKTLTESSEMTYAMPENASAFGTQRVDETKEGVARPKHDPEIIMQLLARSVKRTLRFLRLGLVESY